MTIWTPEHRGRMKVRHLKIRDRSSRGKETPLIVFVSRAVDIYEFWNEQQIINQYYVLYIESVIGVVSVNPWVSRESIPMIHDSRPA